MAITLRGTLQSRWTIRAAAAFVWGLAALSAGYWGLRLGGRDDAARSAAAVVRSPAPPDPVAVAALLGAAGAAQGAAAVPPVAALASRFTLAGVVAGTSGAGAALIAVDGKPPRPFRVGSRVADDLLLQSVQGRRAQLGPRVDGPAAVTLELPPLPR